MNNQQNNPSGGNINYYAEGKNGAINVNETTIELIRKGLSAKLLGLRGNKEILIKSITSIQYKSPGMFTNGFIQFAFSGSSESKGGVLTLQKMKIALYLQKRMRKNLLTYAIL